MPPSLGDIDVDVDIVRSCDSRADFLRGFDAALALYDQRGRGEERGEFARGVLDRNLSCTLILQNSIEFEGFVCIKIDYCHYVILFTVFIMLKLEEKLPPPSRII